MKKKTFVFEEYEYTDPLLGIEEGSEEPIIYVRIRNESGKVILDALAPDECVYLNQLM